MKNLEKIDLKEAERIYIVSNTPLFLARRLKTLPIVENICESFDGMTITKALKKSIQRKPKTLSETVRPYVYLVALSLKLDPTYLSLTTTINAPNYRWFTYISNFLNETYRPLSITTMSVRSHLMEREPSESNTNTSTLNVDIKPGETR